MARDEMASVIELAASVGVDVEKEPQLVMLLQQLLVLPPNWSYDAEAKSYVDNVNGESTPEHPARHFFNDMVERARQSNKEPAGTLPALSFAERIATADDLPATPWLAGAEPPPARLTFKAWFREGSHGGRGNFIRRDLTLHHHTATGTFTVFVQGSDQGYDITHLCDHKTGVTLDSYDLHTGTVVDCLGKPTTLMQAGNLSTSSWIQGEAQHLIHLTRTVSAELRKYGLTPSGTSTTATVVNFRKASDPAEHNLRHLMARLEGLFLDLQDVRPKAALTWARAAEKLGRQKISDSTAEKRRSEESSRRVSKGSATASKVL